MIYFAQKNKTYSYISDQDGEMNQRDLEKICYFFHKNDAIAHLHML